MSDGRHASYGRRQAHLWDEQAEREYAEQVARQRPRRRRLTIPAILFLLTCLSTFWVGITDWRPLFPVVIIFESWSQGSVDLLPIRMMVLKNWDQGLIYMVCVLAILLVHEMGHFVATLIYRVPATVPIFLPFPFNPIGTLGAVIGMQPNVANRRQIFDIGIAGPLAGLVIAIPLCFIGIQQLDFTQPGGGQLAFEFPLLMRWIAGWLGVDGYDPARGVWPQQMNPYLAAAWVGLVVTGLNMMPVGQLDGGHVTYTMFGRFSFRLAEAIIVLAIAYMVYRGIYHLAIMVVLLLLIGTRHPPTSDDNVRLGWFRYSLGLLSLSIPVLCFPLRVFILSE